jgi:hypothetical protein
MVGHNVSPQGVMLNPAIGTLDTEPVTLDGSSNRIMRRFSKEPKMDMWLMYACPYAPNGRLYDCKARAADAHESGTTFLANERTLTKDAGQAQVGVSGDRVLRHQEGMRRGGGGGRGGV